MASNETPKYKLSVTEGTELQLSLLGPTGPAGVSGTITTSTSTNLTGYIFGNGTNIAGATAATSAATASTLVLRAADGTFNAASTANETYTITANSSGQSGISVVGNNTTTVDDSGVGVAGVSDNGVGIVGASTNGTGGVTYSGGGTYHHKFGVFNLETSAPATSAVERVRGWFVWFFSTFTGRLKTADITASRDWTLPNASGTIALIDSSQTFSQSQTFSGAFEITNASVKLSAIPTFADNSAASSLATGSVYKTSAGELRIKY